MYRIVPGFHELRKISKTIFLPSHLIHDITKLADPRQQEQNKAIERINHQTNERQRTQSSSRERAVSDREITERRNQLKR